MNLFTDEKYVKDQDGIYRSEGEQHPLLMGL